MNRNPRYDILFEPVRIGPVTAPNRFYSTPHALGTGNQMPHTRAAMREVRAEGGWGVVNTGYCSIHPSSDDSPLPYCRLWDDEDIKVHALMVDAVHRHGALAGVELWHGGSVANRLTRVTPMSVSGVTYDLSYAGWMRMTHSRPMDRRDIREFRRWYVEAALRARSAGFDIVYIYAGMGYGPYQFLLPWLNKRTDEYGGKLQNRVRLMREIIEDVKEAVGQTCAVAVRFSSDTLLDIPGETMQSEAHEIISMLSELPDLWDVKSANWALETASARFSESGAQEPFNSFVKPLTSKPVVGVGRFTSPDEMVSQVRRGILDFIGAARPTIADPFLPRKIDEGREDEIRECIGCNICVSAYHDGVPVRCTQNPTMGEEWRRKWHPERIPPGDPKQSILIVGAGPAGLECARALGQRGFAVTVTEAREDLGGRVTIESKLPGLSTWARVRDYRTNLIQTMGNVDVYRGSPVSAQDVIDFGCDHAVIATGSRWTREILGTNGYPVGEIEGDAVFTPDDILAGAEPEGPVDSHPGARRIRLDIHEQRVHRYPHADDRTRNRDGVRVLPDRVQRRSSAIGQHLSWQRCPFYRLRIADCGRCQVRKRSLVSRAEFRCRSNGGRRHDLCAKHRRLPGARHHCTRGVFRTRVRPKYRCRRLHSALRMGATEALVLLQHDNYGFSEGKMCGLGNVT